MSAISCDATAVESEGLEGCCCLLLLHLDPGMQRKPHKHLGFLIADFSSRMVGTPIRKSARSAWLAAT
jgi:hypothetical protein